MSRSGFFALVAQFAPGIFRVRPGTWIAVALGLLALLVLLILTVVASVGWLWGQAKGLAETTPAAARGAIEQLERIAPGAREKFGEFVPALKSEPPPRDVSGTDVGPVPRYPGLARSHWHREGREITVRYEGEADYAAVLEHYAGSFAAQGYVQNVLSAAPEGEKHEYRKDHDRIGFTLAQMPKGKVKASIVTVLPAPTF